MLDPQASRFWQATLLSGLMDVEGLTTCWNAIPPESAKSRAARPPTGPAGGTVQRVDAVAGAAALAGRTTGTRSIAMCS